MNASIRTLAGFIDEIAQDNASRGLSDRDRQIIALKAGSPMRPSKHQHHHDDCPLFSAGNEPTLF
ncbi:MAG TPA: hypothetical protein VF638_13010 [Sphingomonas sp.]|jgi:hypothetical protein